MKIEIDQSGKIEETAHDTILAISNDLRKTVRISAKVKRQLQEIFRRKGLSKVFVYATFAAGLYFLLNYLKNKSQRVYIDQEYMGHEKTIIYFLNKVTTRYESLSFRKIGKSSSADHLASKVSHRLERPSRILTFEILERVIQKMTEISIDETRTT